MGLFDNFSGLLGFSKSVTDEPKDNPLNPVTEPSGKIPGIMENMWGQVKGGNTARNMSNAPVTEDPGANQPLPTPPQGDYNTMMSQFGEHCDQTPEGMDDIMNRIAFHETGPDDRYASDISQTSGGPGKGLFQFESGQGAGGMTARNRLARWYQEQGKDAPEWLTQEGMAETGFDASQLSPEQQKMMFMANTRYHPEASLKGVSGDNLTDYWQKYHYAGGEDKTELFGESMEAYRTPEEYMQDNVINTQADHAFTSGDEYSQKDRDRVEMYKQRNWAADDTINMDLWNQG